MKLTNLQVAVAIFSGVSIGLGGFFYSFFAEYNLQDFNNQTAFNQFASLSAQANETSQRLSQQQDLLTRIFTTVGLMWSVLQQIIGLPIFFINLVFQIDQSLTPIGGMPLWFFAMISIIISILIINKVASIFANREEI